MSSEHDEQAKLVARVHAFYPDVVLAAVPNGGLRDKRVAIRLKAEGVLRGFPDLVLMEPRSVFHGAVIEMKRDEGSILSKDQVKVLKSLRRNGYHVIVGHGVEDAWPQVEEYLGWRRSDPPRMFDQTDIFD